MQNFTHNEIITQEHFSMSLLKGERSAGRGSLATQVHGATLATCPRDPTSTTSHQFFIPSPPYLSTPFLPASSSSSRTHLTRKVHPPSDLSCCALVPYQASTSWFLRGPGRVTRVGGGGELAYTKIVRGGGVAQQAASCDGAST